MTRLFAATLAIGICASGTSTAGGPKGGKGSSNQQGGYYNSAHHHNYHRYYGPRYYGAGPYGAYWYDDGDDDGPAAVDDGPPSAAEESEHVPAAAVPAGALIRIRTAPGAKLWFDASPTNQTGAVRTFSTPPLSGGKTYIYEVRACWLEEGRPVVRSRTITVTPGEISEVDLR
jgi:uncharacterized protein (TIGR03000 family)